MHQVLNAAQYYIDVVSSRIVALWSETGFSDVTSLTSLFVMVTWPRLVLFQDDWWFIAGHNLDARCSTVVSSVCASFTVGKVPKSACGAR